MSGETEKLAEIISQLSLGSYLREDTKVHAEEKQEISEKIEVALRSMIDEPERTSQHTKHTLEFIEALWKKYDCKSIAELFRSFVTVEPALLSLGGARDHFVHTFHVFLFGLRIISQIITKMGSDSKHCLKIRDESAKTCVFSYPYNYKERIFYIWTLASTFHDIGFPLEHLPEIEQGLGKFAEYTKYRIAPLYFRLDYAEIIQLDSYLRLMSTLYGGKLVPKEVEEGIWVYRRSEYPHFYKVLISALRDRNHGILSSLILFRVIEDVFLVHSPSTKYRLSPEQFNEYVKYVYNEDISRAALAISLHHLKKETYPPVQKVKFSEYPLAFLLILADEFQQFLRKAVDLGQERVILKKIPSINVAVRGRMVVVKIRYEIDDKEASEIKTLMNEEDISIALRRFWTHSTKILERRLASEKRCKISLGVCKDGKTIFSWTLPR